MKLINNITDLSNKDIGIVLDELNKMVDTIYYGKIDVTEFTMYNRKFQVQISYLKKYTRYDIWEVKNGKVK
jgi:hypothetical protein